MTLRVEPGTVLKRKKKEAIKAAYSPPTLQQKYDFLLSKLQIQDVDLWELDAMIALPERLYFQLSQGQYPEMDQAVVAAMKAEKEFPRVKTA